MRILSKRKGVCRVRRIMAEADLEYYQEPTPLMKLEEKIKGYDIRHLPDDVIPEIRKLLHPRPARNVILFMCIGLGKKEQEIVDALKDEFDIIPVGIDSAAGTYAVKENRDDFRIVRSASNHVLRKIIGEESGIVVGFNMINVQQKYWGRDFLFYDWPLVYNIGGQMIYNTKWSDYVAKEQPEYLDARAAERRKKEIEDARKQDRNKKKYVSKSEKARKKAERKKQESELVWF